MSQVTCPSGLVLEIRGLKNKEINILTDKQAIRDGKVQQQILAASCTVVDAGPYNEPNGKPFSWPDVLIADQTVALIAVRCLTFGSEYDIDVHCDQCRKRISWTVDLSQDLTVEPLSADTLKVFAQGNRFETVLPSTGKKVWFCLTTGGLIQRLQKVIDKNPDKLWTISLAARILEIEGVTDMDRKRFLDEMDAGDTMRLREAFEEHEGGIDTDIVAECSGCMSEQEISLPLGHTLFLPRKNKGKGSRRERDDLLR